jgi:hypothetical protein
MIMIMMVIIIIIIINLDKNLEDIAGKHSTDYYKIGNYCSLKLEA